MLRRRSTLVPALLVPLVLGLGACGSDDPESPGADQSPPTTAPTSGATATDAPAGDPCDVITDERLTDLTGRPRTVGDVTTVGTREECRTTRESDDALEVTWGFQPPLEGDPDVVLDSAAVGLERSDVELVADGPAVPATLLRGSVAGAATVKVVVTIDDLVLVTEASSQEAVIGGEGVSEEVLRDVATGIAEDYLRTGLPEAPAS